MLIVSFLGSLTCELFARKPQAKDSTRNSFYYFVPVQVVQNKRPFFKNASPIPLAPRFQCCQSFEIASVLSVRNKRPIMRKRTAELRHVSRQSSSSSVAVVRRRRPASPSRRVASRRCMSWRITSCRAVLRRAMSWRVASRRVVAHRVESCVSCLVVCET